MKLGTDPVGAGRFLGRVLAGRLELLDLKTVPGVTVLLAGDAPVAGYAEVDPLREKEVVANLLRLVQGNGLVGVVPDSGTVVAG